MRVSLILIESISRLVSLLFSDSIIPAKAFTTGACQGTFKFQSGPLNCDSEKIICLVKVKFVVKFHSLKKRKLHFVKGLIIIRLNTRAFRKDNQKVPQKLFSLIIASLATATLKIGVF